MEGICSYLFRISIEQVPDLMEKPAQLAKAGLSSSLWDGRPAVRCVSYGGQG